MIKVGIKIQYRAEVLDVEARALLHLFKDQKLNIEACSYGKYIELDIPETNKAKALEVAQKAAEDILSNDLVETFKLEVVENN